MSAFWWSLLGFEPKLYQFSHQVDQSLVIDFAKPLNLAISIQPVKTLPS